MRLLLLLLLLAGCADGAPGDPGTVRMRLNGSYTAVGGMVNVR